MAGRDLREEYLAQGFLVFDPGIDERVIDEAHAALRDLYLPEGAPDESTLVAQRNNRRVQDAWKIVPAVKAIATAPRVIATLRELYGRAPRPFQTLNFRMGSEQRTHSDTMHFNARPAGYMCGVWLALEDVDQDNGPVMYYPGSHLWPEATLRDVDEFGGGHSPGAVRRMLRYARATPRDTTADYAIYENLIQARIDAARAKPLYATLRKGQAFIWAANLLHGGSPQRDRARTRSSQVTHFFFEGCRYYTPLLQRGWKTRWRTPDWVR